MQNVRCKALLIVIIQLFYVVTAYWLTHGSFITSRSKLIRILDSNNDITYLDALLTQNSKVKHKYFFPSHAGGLLLPKKLKDALVLNTFASMDLPELDGLDNIHNPQGPLLYSQVLAAKTFGASKTWFLVNGSTGGLHAAILMCVRWYHSLKKRNGPCIFLVGRDSHKSVFDAISLASDCDAVILPCMTHSDLGVSLGVKVTSIEEAISKYGSKICGLLITRPSYQGLTMNTFKLKSLIQSVRAKNIPVLIDEAHGSHLKFLKNVNMLDGLSCGADIVVQSTHKTLHSLSQSAMLHMNKGAFLFNENLELEPESMMSEIVSSLTTTSPNALLLASLDASVDYIGSEQGKCDVLKTLNLSNTIRNSIRSQDTLCRLFDDHPALGELGLVVDPFKLSVWFSGLRALDVDDAMCSEDGIFAELNLPSCITYNIGIGSHEESVSALINSLIKHSKNRASITYSNHSTYNAIENDGGLSFANITGLKYSRWSKLSLEQSLDSGQVNPCLVNKMSAETISLYPPGIPIAVAGERLSRKIIETLIAYEKNKDRLYGSGCSITGNSDPLLHTIKVMD